jgi:hypothetical protein
MKFKKFKIIPDSIIKATTNGYYYCQTDPIHPFSEKRKDRKARYIYLHRVLMENKLNRFLKKDEQVDHIDGDKENNTLSNLRILKIKDHQREHSKNNNFWEKSPLTKPGYKRKAYKVILSYLCQKSKNF